AQRGGRRPRPRRDRARGSERAHDARGGRDPRRGRRARPARRPRERGRGRRLVLRVGAGPAGVLLEGGRGQRAPARDRLAGVRGDLGAARVAGPLDAHGRVRPRRPARRRGDDDPRPLPVTRVTLYAARDCFLCEPVRDLLARLRTELSYELDEVDITGVPELERGYREWIPVVEVDGERAFVYRVDEDELRARLGSPD